MLDREKVIKVVLLLLKGDLPRGFKSGFMFSNYSKHIFDVCHFYILHGYSGYMVLIKHRLKSDYVQGILVVDPLKIDSIAQKFGFSDEDREFMSYSFDLGSGITRAIFDSLDKSDIQAIDEEQAKEAVYRLFNEDPEQKWAFN